MWGVIFIIIGCILCIGGFALGIYIVKVDSSFLKGLLSWFGVVGSFIAGILFILLGKIIMIIKTVADGFRP
ncbi:MAG: hypothetical protein ACLFPF_06240 [Halanaerobiales bacterium]